jgi:hypothetical protein
LQAQQQAAALQAAAQLAAAQKEAARQEAAHLEAARLQAQQQQEAARLEKLRQDALRQDAIRQEAARLEAAKLAAQVPVAPPAAPPEKPRKLTLLGRPDRDERLAVFAEVWSQKIQQNADFEMLNAAKSGPYDNPIVTVTLRVDGSVESVVFKRSSGTPAIDDAIRKIITASAAYAKIPAELAMDYDLIEVSRLWTFGSGLRLARTGR